MIEVTTPDQSEGWLRRAWEDQLRYARWGRRAQHAEHRGYLLESAVPELLEPFVDVGSSRPDWPFLDFQNLDVDVAAALLQLMPASALEQDWSNVAPAPSTLLRAVADHPGTLTCGGQLIGPKLPAEGLQVRSLTARGVSLADVTPDVLPGELGSWLEELPAPQHAAYLRERQDCLEHGRTRQGRATAATRYGITDARRWPRATTRPAPRTPTSWCSCGEATPPGRPAGVAGTHVGGALVRAARRGRARAGGTWSSTRTTRRARRRC